MRILVVGAGAVGGFFGGRLALAGRDVTFLVRRRRAEQLRANGLRIITPAETTTVEEPHLVLAEEIAGPYDAVLLSVKAYDLDETLTSLAPAVGPQTMIVPLLNGMRHIDVLTGRFGAHCVLGGLCVVLSTLDADGNVRQLGDLQSLTYGELDGTLTARARELDAALRGARFDATLSENITLAMWQKWVTLATLGGITCLLRGTIGEIEATGGAPLAHRLLDECAAVASAAGFAPLPDAYARALGTVTAPGAPTTASIYRDLIGGNRVEGDQILGDLLERARGFGLDTPLLAAAYANVAVYQRRLKTPVPV